MSALFFLYFFQIKEVLDSTISFAIADMFISKLECKDQESIQSCKTPDPGYQWESDKLTKRHQKLERRGQPFPSR